MAAGAGFAVLVKHGKPRVSNIEALNLGVVGACGRGDFATAPIPGVRLHAICDIDPVRLKETADKLKPDEAWTDYHEMLERSDLDAVVIATPMPLHVPQAIAALERGLHVMSEVPAGVNIEECRDLVLACKRSRGLYMMAENMNYFRPVQIITQMVRRGLFGETYYAEGEYLHQIRPLFERTPWRRKWQVGVPGITYGTHSLGPILQWMPGDRVTRVCCIGSGRRDIDPQGNTYEADSTSVMLGKTARGAAIKLRLDFLSDRPSAHRFLLQGSDGAFEAQAIEDGSERVWIRSASNSHGWRPLEDFAADHLPDVWRAHGHAATGQSHGGADHIQMIEFINAIRAGTKSPIDIHEAMDMTLPGLVSQQSIQCGGQWLPVPDSRLW